MTLNRAYDILGKECKFLGQSWSWLLNELGENPSIFPNYVRDAYDLYMECVNS